jgi:hypothetical protein
VPILAKENGKRGFPFQIFIQILVFSGLVGLTALALQPVQRVIQDSIRHIRDNLIGQAEALIGRQIRYSSISPSIFGAFDIRNLRILGTGEGSADVLSVSRFRLSWSLRDLFRGSPWSIRSVLIDKPHINLDLERDRDLLELFVPAGPVSRPGLAELMPEDVLFRIRDGQCRIRNWRGQSPETFRIDGLNLDARAADKTVSLDGKLAAGFSLGPGFAGPLNARVQSRITGTFRAGNSGFERGNVILTLSAIEGDNFQVQPLTFNCSLENGVLSLVKLGDRLPFDVSLDYRIREENLNVWFTSEALVLKDLVTFTGAWKATRPWLALALSGSASLDRRADGRLRYRADLAGGLPLDAAGADAGGGGSFVLRAAGNEQLIRVDEFHVSAPRIAGPAAAGLPRGELGFRGSVGLEPLAPSGVLSCKDLSFSGEPGFSGDLNLSTTGTKITAVGKTVAAGPLILKSLNIFVVPAQGSLDFGVSALRSGGLRPGSFSAEGSLDYAPRRLEASCTLRSLSVADITGMARPFAAALVLPAPARSLSADTFITTEVFLSTDFKRLRYSAPRIEAAFDPQPDGLHPLGIISLSGTERRFDIGESRLVFGDNELHFSGYADYSNPMDVSFSLMSNYRDLSYYLEGRVLERNQVSVQGSYGFRVYISPSDGGAWSGYIEGRDIPVPVRGLPARLKFFARLRYHSPDFWSLDLDNFEGVDIAGPAGPGYLRITGGADQDGARFPLIYYQDSISPLSGTAELSWKQKNAGVSGTLSMEETMEPARPASALPAAASLSPERYLMIGSFAEEGLRLAISGSQMRLGRVIDNAHNARANGDLRISWAPARSYQADLYISSLSARWYNREFRASARAALNQDEFTIRDLRLNTAQIEGAMPLFRVSRGESAAKTSASFRGVLGTEPFEGAFTVDARFSPMSSWLGIQNALRSLSGRIQVETLRYAGVGQSRPFDISFSRRGGELSVSGGPRDMLRLRLRQDGTFYAALSSPFPVRGSVAGTLSGNTIDARCADLYVDLAGLWNLLPPVPDIALAGGYVSAQLDIRGSLADPEFYGAARGTSVRIQVPNYLTQDVRPVPFTVAIEGNEMRFGPVPATVGKGAGTVTGVFRFDRWIPNVFTLDIAVPRETPIPFGFDITGFLARGDASGKLRLTMADMVFGISGDLLANNTEMGLNSDELNQAQNADIFAAALTPVTLDLKITTGPTVEFLWPSSGWPILRANPDMGTVVHVSADSTSRQFSLNSDVKIRGGEIFYFERNFYIRSGTLKFRETAEEFNPLLSVRAEIRDRTNDGPVTIAMIVENAPLLSFTARFESNPSLSQAEIIALLGQSITGGAEIAESTGGVPRAFLSSTSDVLAQFGVVRQLERQIRNFLRLDMFSIRTQVLQNAFFNATGLMPDPVDRNGRVGNYFDNTTVFLGKYIGSDMFIQSMLSLRYDENNTSTGGIKIEPDIGVELQTPLFNIRWDFIPTHPENWYVSDNSITLTWSKSF